MQLLVVASYALFLRDLKQSGASVRSLALYEANHELSLFPTRNRLLSFLARRDSTSSSFSYAVFDTLSLPGCSCRDNLVRSTLILLWFLLGPISLEPTLFRSHPSIDRLQVRCRIIFSLLYLSFFEAAVSSASVLKLSPHDQSCSCYAPIVSLSLNLFLVLEFGFCLTVILFEIFILFDCSFC